MSGGQPLADVGWIRTVRALHLHPPSEIASARHCNTFLCQLHSALLQILLYFASQEPCELANCTELEI